MESVDAFAKDTFLKHAVAHGRLMIDVVSILTGEAEIELNDAFVIHVF